MILNYIEQAGGYDFDSETQTYSVNFESNFFLNNFASPSIYFCSTYFFLYKNFFIVPPRVNKISIKHQKLDLLILPIFYHYNSLLYGKINGKAICGKKKSEKSIMMYKVEH